MKNFWTFLICLSISLQAQEIPKEQDILRELDVVIQEYRGIVKQLEEMDMYEIRREINRMKENLSRLGRVRIKIVKLKESSGGSLVKGTRDLKEEIRGLYLKLGEISFVTRTTEWNLVQKRWFSLQSTNPEFLSGPDIAYYQDQLKGLAEEFRKIELRANEDYKKVLDQSYAAYLSLKEDPWAEVAARWKTIERSFEKTWERRKEEEGLSAATAFEELYRELLKIQEQVRERKGKEQAAVRGLWKEVQAYYDFFGKLPLVLKDPKWSEYEQKCKSLWGKEIEKLSPENLERLNVELISLRTIFFNYRVELNDRMYRTYQKAQDVYDKISRDPWAGSLGLYDALSAQWKEKWQNRLELDLAHSAQLELLLDSMLNLQNQAVERHKHLHGEVSSAKENIRKMIVGLESVPLAKQEQQWLDVLREWQELQYEMTLRMGPDALSKYRDRLQAVDKNLLSIHVVAQKKLAHLFDQAKEKYDFLAKHSWKTTVPEWEEVDRQWKTKLAWKTDPSFMDTAEIEEILQKMEIVKAKMIEKQTYARTQVVQKMDSLKRSMESVSGMGPRNPSWPVLAKKWDEIVKTDIGALSPKKIEEYFSELKEFEKMLDKAAQEMLEYCNQLLFETTRKYNLLLKESWSFKVEEWSRLSQEWVLKRPLSDRISLSYGPKIEAFHEGFNRVEAQIKEMKSKQHGEIEIEWEKVADQHRLGQSNLIISRDERWTEWEFQWKKAQAQNYRLFAQEELDQYGQRLSSLQKQFYAIRQEAEASLSSLLNNAQKTYRAYAQSEWNAFLIQKNRLEKEWKETWENKERTALSDTEALLGFKESLEHCNLFWWRPGPPKRPIPSRGFILDMMEVKSEGTPSVPQWSSDGKWLSFLSVAQGQYSVHLMDISTGQIKTIELYDPAQRWVAFPRWAPRPFSNSLAFCGKKMGAYDLYTVSLSPHRMSTPVAVTSNPEYERMPRWSLWEEECTLFFLQEDDLFFKKGEKSPQLLFSAQKNGLAKVNDFAVHWDKSGDVLKLVLCSDKVYYARIERKGEFLESQSIHKIDELPGVHFAPEWTKDGQFVVCYLETAEGTRISRIDPERGRERLLFKEGHVMMPQGTEMRFKPPELFSSSSTVFCCIRGERPFDTPSIVSLDPPQVIWGMSSPEHESLFNETAHLSISPNQSLLAWTYIKEGVGQTLMIGVIRMPENR